MKMKISQIVVLIFTITIMSCGRENINNSNVKDDGSGSVYKRMGIKKPRNLDYQANDFHLAQLNKILFTNDMYLNPEKASAKDFKTTFKAGELIKGVVYLDKSAGEKFGMDGFPKLKYKVGNQSHNWVIEAYRAYDQALPYLEFYITVPQADYIPTKGAASTIANSMETLSELSNKVHALNAEIRTANGSKTNIKGSLEYDATNKASSNVLAEEIKQIRIKHVAAIPQPKANMSEPKIEKQLVEHFNKMGWEEHFIKTIILSDEYKYRKSYAGIIVAKTLSVAMVSETKKGYCMYQVFTVIADKTDDGYSKFKRFSTGDQQGCSCK